MTDIPQSPYTNILLSYLQIIRAYYQKMNATLGHDQRFEFERDQNLITLDIPTAGITTRDKAWTITALGPPVVGFLTTVLIEKCVILPSYSIKMCKEFLLYDVCYSAHFIWIFILYITD